MTVFENIKSKNIDELIDFLDKHEMYDYSPWIKWWDKNYCNKCEPEINYNANAGEDMEYGWCELNGKCKFFQEFDNIPDNKLMLRLWLSSETDEEEIENNAQEYMICDRAICYQQDYNGGCSTCPCNPLSENYGVI